MDAAQLWKTRMSDSALLSEMENLSSDELIERFGAKLTFGTGGLRGRMGVGTARMNIYTVAQATQGLANYLRGAGRVAIAYDSRLQSKEFAEMTARILAANGCDAYLFDRLMPTPLLSFAVRELRADLGVVITASHNPSDYNGYKVYDSNGCQIGPEIAHQLEQQIQRVSIFDDIRWEGGQIKIVPESVLESYYKLLPAPDLSGLKVVYTPLCGAGREPVAHVLERSGAQLFWVDEQSLPDGNFPTCPFPNPERPETMELGIRMMDGCGADLLLATDPDCDRVGVAVREDSGSVVILSGNELGVLMLDYLCRTRPVPENAILVKTFVTTDMSKIIASHYGLTCVEVPVGFKYIGDVIGQLEKKGEISRYFFGFEESCGYLPITSVRDKDGVSASLLICEMADWHKTHGRTLAIALNQLYDQFSYFHTPQKSFQFEGLNGRKKMETIMGKFRSCGLAGWQMEDFSLRTDFSVDMLRFSSGSDTIVVRPSGTEPKIKVYFSICADKNDTAKIEQYEKLITGCMQ